MFVLLISIPVEVVNADPNLVSASKVTAVSSNMFDLAGREVCRLCDVIFIVAELVFFSSIY